MGLFARLLGRQPTPIIQPLSDSEPEKRRGGAAVFASYGAGPITSGGASSYLSSRLAENLSSVVACVAAISNPIASVPAIVYRSIPGGREEAPNHPVARLIESPNPRQTWSDWLSFSLGQVLVHGNSLSLIERDKDGTPVALMPVPWQGTQVILLKSGRLAFDVMMTVFPWSSAGVPLRRLFEDEVFWLRDRSDDGYLGRSVLSRAPEVLKAALGIQTYSGNLFEQAALPSGFIRHPATLSDTAKTFLVNSFEDHLSGARNVGKIGVLDEGMEWQPSAMSPEDAEVLQSRRFTGEEICRLFSVPPPIAGDFQFGSFTNSETAGRWHASLCLSNWCRRIEREMQRSVFGSEDKQHHMMIDLSGLTRGDEAARWANYKIAVEAGILSIDECRALEGFSPMRKSAGETIPGSETSA